MSTKQTTRANAPKATAPKVEKAPKAAPKAKGPKVPDKPCQCNAEWDEKSQSYKACGRLTSGRFAPGHDAKLKGVLIKATREGLKYYVLNADTDKVVGLDPEKVAADLGWSKYTDHAKATPKTAKAPRVSKAAKAADAPAKVAALNEKMEAARQRAAAKKAAGNAADSLV